MQKNGLIRKLWLTSKFITSKTRQKIITIHILFTISRSKSNKIMKFEIWSVMNIQCEKYFTSNITQKEAGGLVPDLRFNIFW